MLLTAAARESLVRSGLAGAEGGPLLKRSSFADDVVANLQLALGIELSVLPPYLYALWSVKPKSEGASVAAHEAARTIRSVAYEEMLHAALVANVLNSLGKTPEVTQHLMKYPGPLPGHVTVPPYAFDVGLCALSRSTVGTFVKIELPEWDLETRAATEWITIGAFYEGVKKQLSGLPAGAFGHGRQMPRVDNPGPGQLVDVASAPAALQAIQTIVDQGEGHKPPQKPPDNSYEDDDDHEVAHYYQFTTIGTYLDDASIDPERDLYPVIDNPNPQKYSPKQQAANRAFNLIYSTLLDSLQATLRSPAPEAFGLPTQRMVQLAQSAAVLRNAGNVPGTGLVAGPTFEYIPPIDRGAR